MLSDMIDIAKTVAGGVILYYIVKWLNGRH